MKEIIKNKSALIEGIKTFLIFCLMLIFVSLLVIGTIISTM